MLAAAGIIARLVDPRLATRTHAARRQYIVRWSIRLINSTSNSPDTRLGLGDVRIDVRQTLRLVNALNHHWRHWQRLVKDIACLYVFYVCHRDIGRIGKIACSFDYNTKLTVHKISKV